MSPRLAGRSTCLSKRPYRLRSTSTEIRRDAESCNRGQTTVLRCYAPPRAGSARPAGAGRERRCIFLPTESMRARYAACTASADTIAKLIEQPGLLGRWRIGGCGVMCKPTFSDMVNVMNHEVSTRRPGYRTCLITPLFRQMSDNSR